jgi:hypothetical protein
MQTASPEPRDSNPASAYSTLAVVGRALALSLLSFSPALLIAILWVVLRSPESTDAIEANALIPPDLLRTFAIGVVVGPLVETALFHLLVIELLLRAKVQRAILVVTASALMFIGVHLTNPYGVASAISVIPGGFVLAYGYLYWRRRTGSWRVASMATWLTHGLHNFWFWLLNFVPASLIFG